MDLAITVAGSVALAGAKVQLRNLSCAMLVGLGTWSKRISTAICPEASHQDVTQLAILAEAMVWQQSL